MERYLRRRILARGRKVQGLDTTLLAAESQTRTRAARAVRAAIRQGKVVILRHPRWADLSGFLEDLAVDFSIGAEPIRASLIDLADSAFQRTPAAWHRLLNLLGSHLRTQAVEGAAWPVARQGFCFALTTLLESVRTGPTRLIVVERAHLVPRELLDDLIETWATWAAPFGGAVPVRLMVGLRAEAERSVDPRAVAVDLPDYSYSEAVDYLVAHLGDEHVDQLRRHVSESGGLPELLRQVVLQGADGAPVSQLADRAWTALAPQVDEASSILRSDDQCAARLERLSEAGARFDPNLDRMLINAGFVRRIGPWSVLRSPRLATTV